MSRETDLACLLTVLLLGLHVELPCGTVFAARGARWMVARPFGGLTSVYIDDGAVEVAATCDDPSADLTGLVCGYGLVQEEPWHKNIYSVPAVDVDVILSLPIGVDADALLRKVV